MLDLIKRILYGKPGSNPKPGRPMYSKKRQKAKMRYWDRKCGGPEIAAKRAAERRRK